VILAVSDGITKALMMFPRLFINERKCEQVISALRNYRKKWDENRLDWLDEPMKDWTSHFADMIRYLALTEDQMTNEDEAPLPPQTEDDNDPFDHS
jgi:hypothetical protein